MIVLGRHRRLTDDAWSELAVRAAIEEIAADSIAHFHPDAFWPAHPSDDGVGDGNASFYFGAAGVMWAIWLDRARQFAMTAIVKYRGAKIAVGRGRYSLWTGDVGLAVYLRDCITGEPRFPTIDVF